MSHSPTPTERLALKTANAALLESRDASVDIVATVVFALGSAQLLQSPESAAEVAALRAAADQIAKLESELGGAAARVAELERHLRRVPSRYSATPAAVDHYLRQILTEETLLNYQRAIGNRAVEEAARDIRMESHSPLAGEKFTNGMTFAADHVDPLKGGGHYPSVLLCGRHNGFGPCPGAPRCTPRDDEGTAPLPQRQQEDPHTSPLHHDYAVSRDLPTTTIETSGSAL